MPDFGDVCSTAIQHTSQSWEETCQNLKKEVKKWSQGTKNPNWELEQIEKEMALLVNQQQTDRVRARIKLLQQQYQTYIAAQEAFWLQRSRLNWDLMGDMNTRFFHTTVMIRRRRNRIEAIQNSNGTWLVTEKEIRAEFVKHFKAIYKADDNWNCDNLSKLLHVTREERVLVPADKVAELEQIPSQQEIERAVNALGPTKAPGLDGITPALVQQRWKVFGPIISNEVRQFFLTGVMKPHNAHSNLVLIPKTDSPLKVSDFRPISVCNIIYKAISKLLAKKNAAANVWAYCKCSNCVLFGQRDL